MGERTYIPTLRFVVKKAHKYATNHQKALEGSLTTDQYTALLTLITALLNMLVALGSRIIED